MRGRYFSFAVKFFDAAQPSTSSAAIDEFNCVLGTAPVAPTAGIAETNRLKCEAGYFFVRSEKSSMMRSRQAGS
jgi:hypothetical protein